MHTKEPSPDNDLDIADLELEFLQLLPDLSVLLSHILVFLFPLVL